MRFKYCKGAHDCTRTELSLEKCKRQVEDSCAERQKRLEILYINPDFFIIFFPSFWNEVDLIYNHPNQIYLRLLFLHISQEYVYIERLYFFKDQDRERMGSGRERSSLQNGISFLVASACLIFLSISCIFDIIPTNGTSEYNNRLPMKIAAPLSLICYVFYRIIRYVSLELFLSN